MKKLALILAAVAMMLLNGAALSLAAAPAGDQAHSAEAAGGHGAPGELVPISEHAQKQAFAQAVWVLIIFLMVLAILYPTAWKGVLNGLKTREQRIRNDIAEAEAARAKAEQTLAEYNRQLASAEERVREMLAKAQADGERLASTIREKATQEAETIKSRALSEIEEARKSAIAQVHSEAAEISTAIAEKIIRRNLNADDQRDLVRASLEQLESGHRN